MVEAVSTTLQELNKRVDELATINETVASATEEQKYTCEAINDNIEDVKDSSLALSQASEQIDMSAIGLPSAFRSSSTTKTFLLHRSFRLSLLFLHPLSRLFVRLISLKFFMKSRYSILTLAARYNGALPRPEQKLEHIHVDII